MSKKNETRSPGSAISLKKAKMIFVSGKSIILTSAEFVQGMFSSVRRDNNFSACSLVLTSTAACKPCLCGWISFISLKVSGKR